VSSEDVIARLVQNFKTPPSLNAWLANTRLSIVAALHNNGADRNLSLLVFFRQNAWMSSAVSSRSRPSANSWTRNATSRLDPQNHTDM